jgi:hypothetical protein
MPRKFSDKGRSAIPHPNRNFVIAYVLLVGLPLLGLAGVLRSGRSLNAPFSVDGSWKIDAGAAHLSAAPCGDFLSSVSNSPVSISQSGTSLVIALGGKTTTGTLTGKTIKAQFAGANSPNATDCSDRALALTATLDPLTEPRTMSGRLSVEGCASCAPVDFRGIRQVRPAGATR